MPISQLYESLRWLIVIIAPSLFFSNISWIEAEKWCRSRGYQLPVFESVDKMKRTYRQHMFSDNANIRDHGDILMLGLQRSAKVIMITVINVVVR